MNKPAIRIEQITKATVCGVKVKLFTVYEKRGGCFVHAGKFSAPVRTANRDLFNFIPL